MAVKLEKQVMISCVTSMWQGAGGVYTLPLWINPNLACYLPMQHHQVHVTINTADHLV